MKTVIGISRLHAQRGNCCESASRIAASSGFFASLNLPLPLLLAFVTDDTSAKDPYLPPDGSRFSLEYGSASAALPTTALLPAHQSVRATPNHGPAPYPPVGSSHGPSYILVSERVGAFLEAAAGSSLTSIVTFFF